MNSLIIKLSEDIDNTTKAIQLIGHLWLTFRKALIFI